MVQQEVKVIFGNFKLVASETARSIKDWWSRCLDVVSDSVVGVSVGDTVWSCEIDILLQQGSVCLIWSV